MDGFKFTDFAAARVEAPQSSKSGIVLAGSYRVELWSKEINGELLDVREGLNAITNEGLDYCLDVTFHNDSPIATWYVGLVDNTGGPNPVAGDTMASHSGWTEWQSYSEGNRQEWTEGAASSQSITNGTSVDFTMSANGTLWGIFIVSQNTKGGTTGTLWSTANFTGLLGVSSSNVVKVTYTVNAA